MAVQSGDRVFRSEAAAYSCSSFSFAELSRTRARSLSSDLVAPRAVVPARTRELTSQPVLRMSSSGVAPTSPSQAKVKQPG
jgi:hypothetical protein